VSPFHRHRSASDRQNCLTIDDRERVRYRRIPPVAANSMVTHGEHEYSLDELRPPHSAKFNSRRDNPSTSIASCFTSSADAVSRLFWTLAMSGYDGRGQASFDPLAPRGLARERP